MVVSVETIIETKTALNSIIIYSEHFTTLWTLEHFTSLEIGEICSRLVKCSAFICSEHFIHTMAIQSIAYLTFNAIVVANLDFIIQRPTQISFAKISGRWSSSGEGLE